MKIPAVSQSAIQIALAKVAQEAMETAAQTKAEATKGDVQAQIKLAKLNSQAPAAASSPPEPPDGTGEFVNTQR